jgi:hypothetical protein
MAIYEFIQDQQLWYRHQRGRLVLCDGKQWVRRLLKEWGAQDVEEMTINESCAGCGEPITKEQQIDALGKKCGTVCRTVVGGEMIYFHDYSCCGRWIHRMMSEE